MQVDASTRMNRWAGSIRLQSTVFVLLSVALFAVTSLLAKYLGGASSENQLHPFQISGCRFIVAFLVIAVINSYKGVSVKAVTWKLHIFRSVFGWLGVSALFAAAAQIPLADANAISFLSVIVAMSLSVFILGETVGIRRWSAALVALVGAVLIARPGTSAFHPAALIALGAAVFIGVEAIILKKLSGCDTPPQILFCNNLIGAMISAVAIAFIWQSPSPVQWIALIAIGIIMLMAQFFNILALQRDEASYLQPFWYAAPLFAALYDYLLFREIVSPWSAVGIFLIIVGGVIISIRSQSPPATVNS